MKSIVAQCEVMLSPARILVVFVKYLGSWYPIPELCGVGFSGKYRTASGIFEIIMQELNLFRGMVYWRKIVDGAKSTVKLSD